jgi:signal peptidase I
MNPEPFKEHGLPAGFWLRALAKLADILALNVVQMALLCLTAVLHVFGVLGVRLFFLILFGVILMMLFYFAFFNCGGRQTFGYRLAGIQVTNLEQQPVGWWRSLGRALLNGFFYFLTGILVGWGNYLMIALTPVKRALHDQLSGTQVVRVAAPRHVALETCAFAGVVMPFVLTFLVVRPFFLQAFYIPSKSMRPTLEVNDRILVNKLYYRLRSPQRGDIVIFWAPPEALENPGEKKEFFKRLIALPGDRVEIKGGKLIVNGQSRQESYIKSAPAYDMRIIEGEVYYAERWGDEDKATVHVYHNNTPVMDAKIIARFHDNRPSDSIPNGKMMVLGDNRNNANDSHKWGLLPVENLIGKVMMIFYPRWRNL